MYLFLSSLDRWFLYFRTWISLVYCYDSYSIVLFRKIKFYNEIFFGVRKKTNKVKIYFGNIKEFDLLIIQ